MPTPAYTNDQLQQAVDLVREHGSQVAAADAVGLPRTTMQSRFRAAVAKGFEAGRSVAKIAPEFEYARLPNPEIPVDELVDHRIKLFEKKRKYEDARRLIPVKVNLDGPIGIWHFGDPHVDDDGTDLSAIREHTRIVRETPGLFGANVGDTTNNWVGRLARLWGQQSTSETDAWRLAEWFLRRVDWLYLIGGNHDAWSGTGDPIKWIQRGMSAPYMSSEVRLELQFPNKNTCRINARHDFSGHSQYNPAHGPMKATMMGVRDHIAIAGHKHISGHGVVKDPDTGATCHSFLVASYKIYDRFALEKGFRDQHLSPGLFTLVDPRLPNTHPDFVTHFWSLERGVEYLKYLRKGG